MHIFELKRNNNGKVSCLFFVVDQTSGSHRLFVNSPRHSRHKRSSHRPRNYATDETSVALVAIYVVGSLSDRGKAIGIQLHSGLDDIGGLC